MLLPKPYKIMQLLADFCHIWDDVDVLLSFWKSSHIAKCIMSFGVTSGSSLMDGFPDELQEVVDKHWEQFPPQHPMIVNFFGIMFSFLLCVGFFGNILVIYVFLATKSLRTTVSMRDKHF